MFIKQAFINFLVIKFFAYSNEIFHFFEINSYEFAFIFYVYFYNLYYYIYKKPFNLIFLNKISLFSIIISYVYSAKEVLQKLHNSNFCTFLSIYYNIDKFNVFNFFVNTVFLCNESNYYIFDLN